MNSSIIVNEIHKLLNRKANLTIPSATIPSELGLAMAPSHSYVRPGFLLVLGCTTYLH